MRLPARGEAQCAAAVGSEFPRGNRPHAGAWATDSALSHSLRLVPGPVPRRCFHGAVAERRLYATSLKDLDAAGPAGPAQRQACSGHAPGRPASWPQASLGPVGRPGVSTPRGTPGSTSREGRAQGASALPDFSISAPRPPDCPTARLPLAALQQRQQARCVGNHEHASHTVRQIPILTKPLPDSHVGIACTREGAAARRPWPPAAYVVLGPILSPAATDGSGHSTL
jgi:hypothetical protein